MLTITNEQLEKIKGLQKEAVERLNTVIGGESDIAASKPITVENASCLVSHAIYDLIAILHELNQGTLSY